MLQEIIDVLAQYTDVPAEEINESSDLIEDLELNSFDVITIVSDFEDQYGIQIPDDQIMEFHTVADIEAYLEKEK
ncbi:MAG: acyl carrier protein [Lachnospiraceae bacterium]|nr:acyl carrier protein [Lachnospiraceae bacterium]